MVRRKYKHLRLLSMSIYDLRHLGGIGDGVSDDGPILAEAARRCGVDGGGMIVVPRGTWLTGSVQLPSRTTLRIEAGATILGSRDPARYPVADQPWEGHSVQTPTPLLWAADAEDVSIVGEGTIDGQGEDWWAAVRAKRLTARPRLVAFLSCRRVQIEGVRLTRSPSWTVHPWHCREVRIDGVTIVNPPHAPNTDGIDPESCRDVEIANCMIDVGDDAIALKAGSGRNFPPCERVTIRDCTIRHGHGGIVIGSEMSGGVRDVTVSDCTMQGTDRGIRIKTRRGRGGVVENLTVRNVLMREVGCPVVIHTYYRYTGLRPEDVAWAGSREPQPVDAGTPLIRGIRLHGVVANDVTGPCLAFICGLPERPIADVGLYGCHLCHREEPDPEQAEPAMMIHRGPGDYPTCGLNATDVAGLRLEDCELRPRGGERVLAERVVWAGTPLEIT
jgi:polygalacturonase